MHRIGTRRVLDHPPVRAVGAGAEHVLLSGNRRIGREPGADAADRRAVFADAVLRQPEAGRRAGGEPQARAAADAADGHRGDLPQAANDASGGGAQDLPVFAAECGGDAARPGVVQRHHVYPLKTRVFVPRGRDGLVQPLCAQLAAVEHAGWRAASAWRRSTRR